MCRTLILQLGFQRSLGPAEPLSPVDDSRTGILGLSLWAGFVKVNPIVK